MPRALLCKKALKKLKKIKKIKKHNDMGIEGLGHGATIHRPNQPKSARQNRGIKDSD
jgi:hypothetical protein